MNLRHFFTVALAATALGLTGCGEKAPKPPADSSVDVIDTTKVSAAFTTASPDAQKLVMDATNAIRSSMYVDALRALDQLSNLQGITPQQKDAVSNLIEQVKAKMAKIGSGSPK